MRNCRKEALVNIGKNEPCVLLRSLKWRCANSICEMDVWSERLSFFSFSYRQCHLMFSLMIVIEGQKNSKDFLETKLGKIIIETSM